MKVHNETKLKGLSRFQHVVYLQRLGEPDVKLPLNKLVVPDLFYKISKNTVLRVLKITFFFFFFFSFRPVQKKKF